MADNYPFDSSNVPYSAVFNQDYTADSALAVSTQTETTSSVSLITIAGGAGGTSGGVGGAGGSVTTLDTTYSASRGSYSGGNGGTASGSYGAGGGGAAGYSGAGGAGGTGGAGTGGTGGAGGGGGASTNQLLLGGGGVGLFGEGTSGSAGDSATAAGGGSSFTTNKGDPHLDKVKLLLKGGTDTPYNLGNPESFSVTRNGSTTGSSRFVTGKYGNAFDFNGTDDYLALSGGDLSGGDWTIEMWINYDVTTQFSGPIATDMDKVLPTGNTAGEFDFHIRETSAPYYMTFFVRDDPNSNISATNNNLGAAITAGDWHHVAASFVSSTNTIYVGVDGTVASNTNSAYASISLGAEDALQIGKNRTGNQFFNGQIDDIRLTKGVARYTSSYTVPAAAHPLMDGQTGTAGYFDSDGAQANYVTSAASSNLPTVSYLVIAGGGSGGADPSNGASAAGGGAGGYRNSYSGDTYSGGSSSLESPLAITLGTNYTVTVGAGGAVPPNTGSSWNNGNNSIFATITSLGGGGGNNSNTVDGDVGSGGGRQNSSAGIPGGAGTTGQGTAGGDGLRPGSDFMGGGGGGAGTAGTNATSSAAGSGGSGLASTITGSSVTRGGGGAASSYLNNHGSAGLGGGGSAVGGAGSANTGGGGGAGRRGASAGAGGSGIVILRYPNSLTISVGAGLTSSTTTDGSDKVTTFTAGTDTVSFS